MRPFPYPDVPSQWCPNLDCGEEYVYAMLGLHPDLCRGCGERMATDAPDVHDADPDGNDWRGMPWVQGSPTGNGRR